MIDFDFETKYEIRLSNRFRRNMKLAKKRGLDTAKLIAVVSNLANDIPLNPKYKDHQLHGDMKQYRECHIAPDWLLVYEKIETTLILYLYATGTHADLLE